ncbi:MAG: glycogen debranching enzyme family protein [Candidatus Rokubacteria bacterium]|nr:glycogen debranching enzyme family protein [Candidatus Rokubacteria bacterium]
MVIEFGREVCGDLAAAEQLEWLVTNGLGGYASGTVAGLLTRRYHGLLVAALAPPLGRTLLVAKLDEMAVYGGRAFPLATNRWRSGAVDPHGYRHIEHFRLEGTTPVWRFACADALLEKRVWMRHGENTTYVRYDLCRASGPLALEIKALVNHRDFHATTREDGWRMRSETVPRGLRITAGERVAPFYLLSDRGDVSTAPEWFYGFDLARERERGLDDRDDHLHAGTFQASLSPDESLTIVISTAAAPALDGIAAWEAHRHRDGELIAGWEAAFPAVAKTAPAWVRQLVLAADQFIVHRPLPHDPDGHSILAGYPWFADWGRDTMISLPGLALATGRMEVARAILRTFARFVDQGLLPNRFLDAGEGAEYNSVDAALWYVEAVRAYHAAAGDDGLVRELFPVLAEIIAWYANGTRYGIHVDPTDGLLCAGEPGVQLTWMDAKVGDWVVTPRAGKPVEVNALWYNALLAVSGLARRLGKPAGDYETLGARAQSGFQRFWNAPAGYCFDVLDGPDGADATLRPNQIFAVSLPASPLPPAQQRGVVDTCARHLLTARGLRSLAPTHPDYQDRYVGDQRHRDAAYHQGTVWGWLLGPFALAHLRVYRDPIQARSFLEPMADHLTAHGLGSLAEIFDGAPPFRPDGCIAQAWTVAEVLRAWIATATPGRS